MTAFNILFGIALVLALFNLFVTGVYAKSIRQSLENAAFPPLREALKDNNHFTSSTRRAIKEREQYGMFWVPFAWSAVITLIVAWWTGSDTGMLNDADVLAIVVSLTPAIARHYTHPVRFDWLVIWTTGMESVMLVLKMQAMEARIKELEADEKRAPGELEGLRETLAAFQKATGIQSVPTQPAETE